MTGTTRDPPVLRVPHDTEFDIQNYQVTVLIPHHLNVLRRRAVEGEL